MEITMKVHEETTLEAIEAAKRTLGVRVLGVNDGHLDEDSVFELSLAILKAWSFNPGSYNKYIENCLEEAALIADGSLSI